MVKSEQIVEAFGQEVHTFLHCHLRGYDKAGDGVANDLSYYDKYGAPVFLKDSWQSGYRAVEERIAGHIHESGNKYNNFPPVAAVGGSSHLYYPCGHNKEPWNWTGNDFK